MLAFELPGDTLNMILQIVISLVGIFLMWIFRIVFKKYKETETYQEIYDAFEGGVAQAQEDFVIWAKRDAADGKLSRDDRARAMRIAYNTALKLASNEKTRKLMTNFTTSQINAWVKKVMNK